MVVYRSERKTHTIRSLTGGMWVQGVHGRLTPTRQGARAEELAVGEVCVRGAREAHTHSAGCEG